MYLDSTWRRRGLNWKRFSLHLSKFLLVYISLMSCLYLFIWFILFIKQICLVLLPNWKLYNRDRAVTKDEWINTFTWRMWMWLKCLLKWENQLINADSQVTHYWSHISEILCWSTSSVKAGMIRLLYCTRYSIAGVCFSPVFLLFTAQGELLILRESGVSVPVRKLYPQLVLLLLSQLGDVLVPQPVFTWSVSEPLSVTKNTDTFYTSVSSFVPLSTNLHHSNVVTSMCISASFFLCRKTVRLFQSSPFCILSTSDQSQQGHWVASALLSIHLPRFPCHSTPGKRNSVV